MSTKKQQQVLAIIKEFKLIEGDYPTQHQIAEAMGIKTVSTVHKHISELVNEGILVKSESHTGYELPIYDIPETESQSIPLLGYITAGMPIEAIEDSSPALIKISRASKRPSELYALKVKGDSMIDEGIYDGDIVVIKRQSDAYDGQTVVAVVDENQVTLKKIYKEAKGYRLQPANQTMLPIYRDEVEIRGIIWEIQSNNTESKSDSTTNTFRTIDLFAGIGGIRIGFERAGFKTVFANDFEKNCKLTYDLNFPDSKLVVEDLTKIEARDLPEFDFLLGGFPCQAFSIAGYRSGFNDAKGRGNLFFDIARILDERKPKGFLLENVKNLKTHDGGNTFEVIKKTLKDLGYHIKYKVLNSMEYGNVPQNRERIYIVGFKDRKQQQNFEFPEPINLTNTIENILEKEVEEKYYYNGKPLYDRLKDDVKEKSKVYQWRRQYVRENKKGVSPTLTANMGMGGHNVPIVLDGKGIRKLTPRECARIQGYPESYQLPKIADSALYKQIGNSVSVPVIERIAKQMAVVI
jgi:DNA (cytosine-5)-methyltransferase 1